MAAVASQRSQQRKPQAVYGKARRTASHADFFDDDEDELALPAPKPARPAAVTKPTFERAPQAKETNPTTKPTAEPAPVPKKKGALPSKAKSPPKKVDTFDIPSSDDEARDAVRYVPVMPKVSARHRLVDDRVEESATLDPFSKKVEKTTNTKVTIARVNKGSEEIADSQDKFDSATARLALTREKRSGGSGKSSGARKPKATATEVPAPNLSGLSASERLKLRAKKANARSSGDEDLQPAASVTKRSEVASEVIKQPQTKRRRLTPQEDGSPADVEMADPPSSSSSRTATPERKSNQRDDDIYDVPAEGQVPLPTTATARIAAIRARSNRPQIATRSSRRNVSQQSVSAPEELNRMLSTDNDIVLGDADTSTPARASTPQPHRSPNSKSPGQQTSAMTPKQTQAWAEFFEPTATRTPSADLERLDLSGRKREAKATVSSKPHALTRSSSDIPTRRVRLVDRLKASAVSSSESDTSDNDDDDDSNEKQEPRTIDEATLKPTTSRTNSQMPMESKRAVQNSQSQSQGLSQERHMLAAEPSSNVTYAKQRSYLAEENLESMMLDVPLDTPQRPAATARRTGKPAAASKTTVFDLDDSDNEGPSGLRNIHELRAGGRATRVMGEVSALLGEIADHNVTARSRRRGALLELGTQLLDKTFAAEQFVGHGFEQHLLAEIHAPSDSVADFLLASAFLLLLGAELPAHTTQCFAMGLPWLAKLLPESTDIGKVVKERRNNMSRSAQGDLVAFAGKVRGLSVLWAENQPIVLSSRLVSMKALDFLVGALRQQGDRSDLLDNVAVGSLLPVQGFTTQQPAATESNISISVLEALSTLSASSTWPGTVITAISKLPALFATKENEQHISPESQSHVKWLAYRLCNNITNDTSLDPATFLAQDAVTHLLREIVVGFDSLSELSSSQTESQKSSEDSRARSHDLLILALGILMSITEHSSAARTQAIAPHSLTSLQSIVQFFLAGYARATEVENLEESNEFVVVGYTAVMLAGLCQEVEAKEVISGFLSSPTTGETTNGKKQDEGLNVLIAAVEQFTWMHQQVDRVTAAGGAVRFEGEEGKAVWSAYTEKLVEVLARLKSGQA